MNFDTVPTTNSDKMFFRAKLGNDIVWVTPDPENPYGVEPNTPNGDGGLAGGFLIHHTGSDAVTVFYRTSGTASNGVDYVSTNVIGSVTIGAGLSSAAVVIQPIEDTTNLPPEDTSHEFSETVTLSLTFTNNYLIDPTNASATILIFENPFIPVTPEIDGPVGIDYHQPSNALVISCNYPAGGPNNFDLIFTNTVVTNVTVTSWSGIANLTEEIKLTTVKTNAHGFTNGDMYFGNGSPGGIGWLSADGTRSNLNWATLPGETNNLRGGLYVDQSGTFGGDLIVATGNTSAADVGLRGVWRVKITNGLPSAVLVTNILTKHLEGVITLTNDVAWWGPWAGKIITGDESATDTNDVPRPLIYAVSTNGSVASFALGIEPEDFDIIPTNQDLYCLDQSYHKVLKVPRTYFTNHVGDLLITQEGAIDPLAHPAALFIVHWCSSTTNFVISSLPYIKFAAGFEHVTFAPIDLPPLTP